MSVSDVDLQKWVQKAASLLIDAPVLKVPQAMLAINFSTEESKDPAMQMKVRRKFATMTKLHNAMSTVLVGETVSVPCCSLPTTSTISSLTSSDISTPLEQQMDNITPPKLDEVRLTATVTIKNVTNKK